MLVVTGLLGHASKGIARVSVQRAVNNSNLALPSSSTPSTAGYGVSLTRTPTWGAVRRGAATASVSIWRDHPPEADSEGLTSRASWLS